MAMGIKSPAMKAAGYGFGVAKSGAIKLGATMRAGVDKRFKTLGRTDDNNRYLPHGRGEVIIVLGHHAFMGDKQPGFFKNTFLLKLIKLRIGKKAAINPLVFFINP